MLQTRAWNEEDHPRVPAGSSDGGQFGEGGGNEGGDESVESLAGNEELAYLLSPKSAVREIGKETGVVNKDGISFLKTANAPEGYESHRLLYSEGGKIVGAMQITKTPSVEKYIVANTFVDPQYRRQGIATKLDQAAVKRFGELDRSRYESEVGQAFAESINHPGGLGSKPSKKSDLIRISRSQIEFLLGRKFVGQDRFIWVNRGRINELREFDESKHPRDEHGKWTDGGGGEDGGTSEHPGPGYSAAAHLVNGVIHTSSVYDAQRALSENRKVELNQPRTVSVLLQRLGDVSKKMIAAGKEAPVFNLCNVSVKGTNLFCADTKGIPRVQMPQLDDQQTKDFRKYLEDQGYKVEKSNTHASHLRATQNELNGIKVAATAEKLASKPGHYSKRIIVSKDDYILDGHHHWAAKIGLDAADGDLSNDTKVKIARVDISITKLLEEAEKFTGGKGKISVSGKDWDESKHPRVPAGSPDGGQFGEGGGGEEVTVEGDTPELHPEVLNVGGDQWNKETATRLEKEYVTAAPKLEKIVSDAVRGKVEVSTDDKEGPDPDEAPVVPEEWDMMSQDQQDDAEKEYKDKTYDEYHESEVNNWYENGALDDAGNVLASDFTSGENEQWALDAINEYRNAVSDDLEIPFSSEQLLKALTIDYESSGYSNIFKGLTIDFDDSKLSEPIGFDTSPSLPGIEPQVPSALLTDEMRKGLLKVLGEAFEKEAEDVQQKLEPPDYLDNLIAEFQEESWSSMTDKDKFSWLNSNTNIVEDAQKEYDDYFGNNKPGGETGTLDQLPKQFDPLEKGGSNTDYLRTRVIARHLSIERTANLMIERKILTDLEGAREAAKKMDRVLWDGWKGSSHGNEGQLLQAAVHDELGTRLNTRMVNLNDAKETAAHITGTGLTTNPYDAVKAYVRAKWETTQFLLAKSGDNVVNVYRAVNIPETASLVINESMGKYFVKTKNSFDTQEQLQTYKNNLYEKEKGIAVSTYEKHGSWVAEATHTFDSRDDAQAFISKYQKDPDNPLQHNEVLVVPGVPASGQPFIRLPDIHIVRNGAASMTTNPGVANAWDGNSGRVVLRASVPRTAVLSVPVYGQNLQHEHEVVVAGAAWKGWDAWYGKAPNFDVLPVGHQIAA